MTSNPAWRAVRHYGQVGAASGVEAATPHRLIQMLMAGALARIATARGHMRRRAVAKKGENISWAISIIEGLRASLDKSSGGATAENLENLYEYMVRRLLLANLRNDPAILDEVHALLSEVKSGWDAIGDRPAGDQRGHGVFSVVDAHDAHGVPAVAKAV